MLSISFYKPCPYHINMENLILGSNEIDISDILEISKSEPKSTITFDQTKLYSPNYYVRKKRSVKDRFKF